MTINIEEMKKYQEKLETELPIQESLSGCRKGLSPANQTFVDARVIEIRKEMAKRFEDVDFEIGIAMAAVAQASDDLRKALDRVSDCMDKQDCEGAAALGYRDVSSGFIFLQRTLGDLQSAGYLWDALISEIAGMVGYSFEEVAAIIPKENLERKKMTPEEAEKLFQEQLKNFKIKSIED